MAGLVFEPGLPALSSQCGVQPDQDPKRPSAFTEMLFASLQVLGEDQQRRQRADGWRLRSEGGSGVAWASLPGGLGEAEGQEDGDGR